MAAGVPLFQEIYVEKVLFQYFSDIVKTLLNQLALYPEIGGVNLSLQCLILCDNKCWHTTLGGKMYPTCFLTLCKSRKKVESGNVFFFFFFFPQCK